MKQFLQNLSDVPRSLLDWLLAGRSDYRKHRGRKSEPRYRARKGLCVGVWAVAGAIMALYPSLQVVIVNLLGATFLSFAILDESE